MQNERVKLPIKGINRKIPGAGHCDEIINLRNNKGVWETMGKKDVLHDLSALPIDSFPIRKIIKFECHDADDMFIVYTTTAVRIINASIPSWTTLHSVVDNEVVENLYQFGNTLIIVTNITRYYYSYSEGVFTRQEILSHNYYGFCTADDTKYLYGEVDSSDVNIALSALRNDFNDHQKQGLTSGHSYFIVAFKTYSGKYMFYSQPYYYHIGMPNLNESFGALPHNCINVYNNETKSTYRYNNVGSVLFTYNLTSEGYNKIQAWKSEIKSLCVFMSKPKQDRNIEDDIIYNKSTDPIDTVNIPYDKTNFDLDTKETRGYLYKNTDLFYLIHEIKIENLVYGEDTSVKIASDYTNIESKETLPINQFTDHEIFSPLMYEYNSRLHIGKVKTNLSDGQTLPMIDYVVNDFEKVQIFTITDPATGTQKYITYDGIDNTKPYVNLTYISVNKEDKVAANTVNDVPIWKSLTGHKYIILNPVVAYNDSRAYHNSNWIKELDGKYYQLSLSYTDELNSHDFILQSFSENKYTIINGDYAQCRLFLPRIIEYTPSDPGYGYNTLSQDQSYEDVNRVQVSELNTCNYFPAENSYRVGKLTNEVVSLMSQAQPLSEGQFGMFPLYVFTTNGIYALEQGENDVLYKSIQPVSLDVAVGEAIPVLDGVIFPSQKGVMVLTGRRTTCISEPLHAKPLTEMPLTYYDNLVNGTDDVITTEALSLIDFRDYIKDAIITYDYMTDEVIVSSTKKTDSVDLAYKYSYVYSIKQGVWYKTDEYYEELFGKYGYLQGVIYDLSTETDILRPILIKTTPFTFGNLVSFDRIAARFRGNYSKTSYIAGSIGKCALYLYGSLSSTAASPTSFHPVSGIKTDAALVHSQEVMLRRSRTTARWFILVFAINSSLGVIDEFEADIVEKYANRIR